jgi:signal transduction histidine kinase/DNA-binding NarL/FixJ family response regulator
VLGAVIVVVADATLASLGRISDQQTVDLAFGSICLLLMGVVSRSQERQHTALIDAERRAAAKAQRGLEFLATMAHEIRNPLEGVLGIARLLETGDLGEEQRELVRSVVTATQMQIAVLNDMTDMVLVEGRRMEFESVPLDLRAWSLEIIRLFESKARNKGLALRCEIDPALPPVVSGDPTRLRQILINLIANAIRFTDEGSVTLSLTLGKTGVRMSVIDTGIGIASQALPRIFEPFTQEDGTIYRRYGGSGLGLTVCRQLIRAMGGIIDVQSTPGLGSTFWIEVALPSAALFHASTAPLDILLVEDNAVLGQIDRLRLADAGHAVTLVDSGEEALAVVHSRDFDVVLMDIQLGGMNGVETAHRLHAMWPRHKRCPLIVAHTAGTTPSIEEAYGNAGFDGRLAKGFEETQLAHLVGKLRGAARTSDEAKATSTQELIDSARLRELWSACGSDGLGDLVKAYIESSTTAIAALLRCGDASDASTIIRTTDVLATQSADIGLPALVNIAGLIEDAAYGGDAEVLADLNRQAAILRRQSLAALVSAIGRLEQDG